MCLMRIRNITFRTLQPVAFKHKPQTFSGVCLRFETARLPFYMARLPFVLRRRVCHFKTVRLPR